MYRKFLYPFVLLVLVSCSDSIQEDLTNNNLDNHFTESIGAHHVRYSDIVTLTRCENPVTRASFNTSPEIECITNKNNDTLLYVCHKQSGGWKIYSSDTRVPAIVAASDEGSFAELMQIEGAKLWIKSMADDMATIKQLSDDKLNFSPEEIENNKAFWRSISSPDEYVKEKINQSPNRWLDLPILPHDPGHFEFYYSRSYSEVYDSIPRLTVTNWHQSDPYNCYCPARTDTTLNAPAGCVAIAGAQMLYFLHNKLGVPERAPSNATCYGNIDCYAMHQDNFTTTVWDSMNTNGYKAAPLIANVGVFVGMDYGNTGSSADTEDLVEDVFEEYYNISCTYVNYNNNISHLRTSLLNGMPVILSAHSSTESGGHAFIADRYKRTRTVTVNYYRWVYDVVPEMPERVPDIVEYQYQSPVVSMIGMNWGWGSYYNNPSEWFSLTGDWIVGNYNWNESRHMIYGFHVIN
jgi:hypothetical protein